MNNKEYKKNDPRFKSIYQDYNWCYQKYIIEGLNHEEMAKEAETNKRAIKKWCCEKHRLTQKYRQINKQLNDKQINLIIGSMLGDGHIDRRETQPMFIVSHAENQKDYLYFKYDILKDLCNISPVYIKEKYYDFGTNKKYLCQPQYRLCTRLYDCFKKYRNTGYSYLINLLNEFSLSIWILDDGNRESSNWDLCIAQYTEEDINLAINIFKDRFNLNSWRINDLYLTFDAISSRKIDQIILNNIPNNLDIIKYKILEKEISKEQKRIYINFNNQQILLKDFCNLYKLNYKYIWQRLFKNNIPFEIILKECEIF